MEFSGEYLSYEEYKDLGGTLDLLPFNLLEFEARRQINIRTFNRINADDITQEIKLCDYNLINSLKGFLETNNNIVNGGNVKSENTDGYSISYVSASEISDIVKSKQSEIDDIVRTYLLGVIYNGEHLIYSGVD